MATLEFTLLLLACVLVSAVIDQVVPKISSPLIQIGLGIVIAVIAGGSIDFSIDSNLFMVLFIAPLLYNEAQQASKTTLAKNRAAILSLAIGLVIAITLIVGFTLNWLIPSIPLAAAFALGAALGPTDAVAVTSLPDNVRLGPRREGILKGESLINDASGIVSFQFAIAAVTTGTFSALDASLDFARLFFGGIAAGLAIGFLSVFIMRRVRAVGLENTTFHVLFDVFLPFIVYFAGEALHTSGVIAVVCAGIVKALSAKEISPALSKMNIVSSSVWRVLVFALNGVVFVLLGAMMPEALMTSWMDETIRNSHLIAYVVCITFIICLVRFLWIFAIENIHSKKQNSKTPMKEIMRSSLVMTIGGAKGAVAMAIIFTVPAVLVTGNPFPGRPVIIFIAGGVVLLTLILANFALPILMPKQVKAQQESDVAMQEDLGMVTIEILRKIMEDLSLRQTSKTRHATQNVLDMYASRIEAIKNHNDFDNPYNVQIRLKALLWEREYVNSQVQEGNVNPVLAYRYLNRISNAEDLLTHKTSFSWKTRNSFTRLVSFVKMLPKRTKNIVKSNNIRPGETAQFSTTDLMKKSEPVNDMKTLRMATVTHVINMLTKEIQNNAQPTEDVSNVLMEYRRHQSSLMSKTPSLTTVENLNEKTEEIRQLGLSLEQDYIREKYEKREITHSQYRALHERVLLMQVAIEEF